MIQFGYKRTLGALLRIVGSVGIGLVLILMPYTGPVLFGRIVAATLFAAGVAITVYAFATRDKLKPSHFKLLFINAGILAVLGFILLMWPGILAGMVVTVVGIAIVAFALIQLVAYGSALSFLGIGYMGLIFSGAALIGGILILFNPFKSAEIMSILAGSVLVYYGVSELLCLPRIRKAYKDFESSQVKKDDAPQAGPDRQIEKSSKYSAKDADYQEVDNQ